jgi:hypothetical protein
MLHTGTSARRFFVCTRPTALRQIVPPSKCICPQSSALTRMGRDAEGGPALVVVAAAQTSTSSLLNDVKHHDGLLSLLASAQAIVYLVP